MHANKKSQMLKAFIQILFFVMLFFVAFKAYNLLMGFWINDLEQGTTKSLEGLQIEIDNMVKDQMTVPIYIDDRHQIKGFVDAPYRYCKNNRSCICICKLDSKCKNNAVKECKSLDVRLTDEFVCKPYTDKETEKPAVFNVNLFKGENGVKVEC